jgi:hypothetical protein
MAWSGRVRRGLFELVASRIVKAGQCVACLGTVRFGQAGQGKGLFQT